MMGCCSEGIKHIKLLDRGRDRIQNLNQREAFWIQRLYSYILVLMRT